MSGCNIHALTYVLSYILTAADSTPHTSPTGIGSSRKDICLHSLTASCLDAAVSWQPLLLLSSPVAPTSPTGMPFTDVCICLA